MDSFFVHETSIVDHNVEIGEGTRIWYFCHIQEGAKIGKSCSLGQNVNISNNVIVGNGVKIQNNVSVYEGVELEDYVFCGPSMVFTNDLSPRARWPKGCSKYKKTLKHDATLGANCIIICGNVIGEYSLIAAGAVVTKDVPAYALMVGIPAKQMGWVCKCGKILNDKYICLGCGSEYIIDNGILMPK